MHRIAPFPLSTCALLDNGLCKEKYADSKRIGDSPRSLTCFHVFLIVQASKIISHFDFEVAHGPLLLFPRPVKIIRRHFRSSRFTSAALRAATLLLRAQQRHTASDLPKRNIFLAALSRSQTYALQRSSDANTVWPAGPADRASPAAVACKFLIPCCRIAQTKLRSTKSAPPISCACSCN